MEKEKKKRTPVRKAKKIDAEGIPPEKQLFHDIKLNVYPRKISINEITFWPENARNLLDFTILEKDHNSDLADIDEKDIIMALAKRPEMKLADLKRSIMHNGVRVPLIIQDDGTLLDGNRRYFASKLLQYEKEKKKEALPETLKEISVWVILTKDLDDKKKDKILAEANFVPDYKVKWPLDVRVKVIARHYKDLKDAGKQEEEIYSEIIDTFAIKKQEIKDYIAASTLAKEFIDIAGDEKEEFLCRRILESKFVYFWEFYNKACKGQGALRDEELSRSKEMFFKLMRHGKLKNIKQVEPAAKAVRDKYSWQILSESQGDKIKLVQSIFLEKKETKSIEDKIRNFVTWFEEVGEEKLQDENNVTKATYKLIGQLVDKLTKYT